MNKAPPWAGTVLALSAVFQASACEMPSDTGVTVAGPGTAQPTPSDSTLVITSFDDLTPGAAVRLHGRNLDRLESLTVDGVTVTFRPVSAQAVEFDMPVTAACDVDGRPTEIVANDSVTVDGALRLNHALRLEVGESRILSAEDLECLQISSAAETYLLTVNNRSRERIVDEVLAWRNVAPGSATVGVHISADAASSMSHAIGAHRQDALSCAHAYGALTDGLTGLGDAPQLSPAQALVASAQWEPVPFDDYENAQVGDILEFVNWNVGGWRTAETRDEVPAYNGQVVAATKGQLIVVDLRTPNPEDMLTTEAMTRYQRAAELADAYTTRAVRAVIDPGFQMPDGIGGRMVTMLDSSMVGSSAGGAVDSGELYAGTWAGDFFRARLNPSIRGASGEVLASIIIHEAAHLADFLPRIRGYGHSSTSFYTEAVAVSVEDMAARMHAGREWQADATRALRSDELSTRITQSPGLGVGLNSPWGTAGSLENTWGGYGPYERGARIVRYVQEVLGQGGWESRTGPTLHQRLLAQAELNEYNRPTFASFDIRALAREAGMSVEELLHRSMLADVTDDRIAADVVARLDIPQTTVWDNTRAMNEWGSSTTHRPRDRHIDAVARVPAGTYAHWYIPALEGLGYTIQATQTDLQPHHEVRLMRLR